MNTIYIIGINGGKKDGQVDGYLKQCLQQAQALGATTNIIELADYNILPIAKVATDPEHDSLDEIKTNDLGDIIKQISAADGIIFATPVHWFAPSSEMKLLIDRLTPFENSDFLLEGKVSGFIVYGNEAGKMNTLMQLSAATNHMGMLSPPYAMIYLNNAKSSWAKKDILLLAKNMVKLIKAIKTPKLQFGYE